MFEISYGEHLANLCRVRAPYRCKNFQAYLTFNPKMPKLFQQVLS
jgi:hypothetical protein